MFIRNKQKIGLLSSKTRVCQLVITILVIALSLPYYAQARIQQHSLLKPATQVHQSLKPILTGITNQIDVRIFLSAYKIKTIEDYANWLKENMRYQADGDRDIWSMPIETLERGFGDCEDLAFLTAEVIRTLGYQPQVVAVGLKKEAHVVCMFKKDGNIHVFDNTSHYISGVNSMELIFKYLLAKKKAYYMLELTLSPKKMKVLYALVRRKTG